MNANTISSIAILANIGLAVFVGAVPAGHELPWWVIAGAAALNVIVHALPNASVVANIKGVLKRHV